jgi:hypothetical protein
MNSNLSSYSTVYNTPYTIHTISTVDPQLLPHAEFLLSQPLMTRKETTTYLPSFDTNIPFLPFNILKNPTGVQN